MSAQRFVAAIIGGHGDKRRDALVEVLRERTRSLRVSGERLEIVDQNRLKSLPCDVRVVVVDQTRRLVVKE